MSDHRPTGRSDVDQLMDVAEREQARLDEAFVGVPGGGGRRRRPPSPPGPAHPTGARRPLEAAWTEEEREQLADAMWTAGPDDTAHPPERRTERLIVRVTPSDHERLKREAAAGLTVSELVCLRWWATSSSHAETLERGRAAPRDNTVSAAGRDRLAGTHTLARAALGPRNGYGTPGRSAMAIYQQRGAGEVAAWVRTIRWRAAAMVAAGMAGAVLVQVAGFYHQALLVALAAGGGVDWWLRFRVSPGTGAWRNGAKGARVTARLLRRLHRRGYVCFHDIAIPGMPAAADHQVVGPAGSTFFPPDALRCMLRGSGQCLSEADVAALVAHILRVLHPAG